MTCKHKQDWSDKQLFSAWTTIVCLLLGAAVVLGAWLCQ